MSSNIHGINSFGNNNNNRNNDNNQNFRPAMLMSSENEPIGNIREETFPHFLKSMCCPHFTIQSVIFWVSLIDIIVYIITLCFGIQKSATELLAPTYNTLDKFGMKIPSKIHSGQIYRLILFGILHANLIHICMNLFSQIIVGSLYEYHVGLLNAGLVYLLSNIGGGIFSCLISNSPGVGASVAIFGILGAYLSFNLINWNYLDRVMGPMNKFCNLIFMIMIVFINISYGFNNSMIDNWGHLGGLMFGFFLGFVFVKVYDEADGVLFNSKIWRTIGIIVSIVLFVGFSICFFALRHPK